MVTFMIIVTDCRDMFKFQWFITVFPTILLSWEARNRDTHDEIVTIERPVVKA